MIKKITDSEGEFWDDERSTCLPCFCRRFYGPNIDQMSTKSDRIADFSLKASHAKILIENGRRRIKAYDSFVLLPFSMPSFLPLLKVFSPDIGNLRSNIYTNS